MIEIVEYLRELTEKERALEFYLLQEKGISYEWRDTRPFLEKTFDERTLAVRYLNSQGLCGISYTLDLSREGIKAAIERSKSLSRAGLPSVYPSFSEEYPLIERRPYFELSKESILEILEEERKILLEDKAIRRIEREAFSCGEEEIFLIREGRVFSFSVPLYSFLISVVADSGMKSASAYTYQSAISFDNLDILKLSQDAKRRAKALSLAEKGVSLKARVLFPPLASLDLLSLLSFSLKGDEVIKGRSFLKDKIGKKIFSEELSVIDDGLNPSLPETRPFDDEGLPQKRKILIKEGVVEGFIWDAFYGEKTGFSSTGNARRPDPSSPPKVDFTNLYIEKGSKSPSELLNSSGFVFEVLEILGAHTADPISGDFSFGVSGILWEKGEPVKYLCEMGLSGNIFELFRDLEIGNDLTFFGDTGAPSLFFPSMDLG
ncbi:hypothetical protein THC_0285 [Caldimicrobium thiodismutans]|uniref:TldD/PmbA family protein n=1 Tax=Caldimicrobium thiodismutans TaxID=1653476 RepID=A0A0U4W0J2_9BACT|nr:metallopeptidase TldD-related protein [Caldimicrobium thiodismutans]BAU22683.1 hypothetical protein THC_0285 [Caldimicrobium thiodismutans]